MAAEEDLSIEDIMKALPAVAKAAGAKRFRRIERLRMGKERALRRELLALASTGAPGSDLEEQIERRLEAIQRSRAKLRADSERLSLGEVEAKEEVCIVHGRVVDQLGGGIVGWTVAAADGYDITLKRATTGKFGEFRLEFGSARDSGVERGRSGRSRDAAKGSGEGALDFYLRVFDDHDKPVYQDDTAIRFAGGGVVYREIVLVATNA